MFNYDYSQTNEYLTENLVGVFLNEFLPNIEFIHDKQVPNSGIKNRPDFRSDKLKMIIEFNGKFHYTNVKNILNDYKKKEIYTNMGYTVISIPYWIQFRMEVIHHIFPDSNIDKLKDFNLFKHGFQANNCPLPSSFCSLGTKIFLKERLYWGKIIDKLYKYVDFSLLDRILKMDSFFQVSQKEQIPYFKEFFNNNGNGFGYIFDKNDYPNIQKELDVIW